MKLERHASKIKPTLRVADDILNLTTLDTNVLVKHLDEQIRLREMSVESRFKKKIS